MDEAGHVDGQDGGANLSWLRSQSRGSSAIASIFATDHVDAFSPTENPEELFLNTRMVIPLMDIS